MLTPNELRTLVADKSSREALVIALAEYDKLHSVQQAAKETAKPDKNITIGGSLNTGKVK